MLKRTKIIFILSILALTFIFNVSSAFALSIMVHVPEKYTNVEAGERFYFEVEIKYPENPARKDLRLNYEILKDGELVAQAKFLKAIETQASFMDYIVIPEDRDSGMYIINITIEDYEDLHEEVSASFHVVSSKDEQFKKYFFILLGVIFFVGMLVLVNIFVSRKRSK